MTTIETRLIDGSSFRLPGTGVFTARGVNMEKEGVAPDVAMEALPEDLAKGIDNQLKKAVEVLSVDVAEWKKNKTVIVVAPIPPATGMGTTPPAERL